MRQTDVRQKHAGTPDTEAGAELLNARRFNRCRDQQYQYGSTAQSEFNSFAPACLLPCCLRHTTVLVMHEATLLLGCKSLQRMCMKIRKYTEKALQCGELTKTEGVSRRRVVEMTGIETPSNIF